METTFLFSSPKVMPSTVLVPKVCCPSTKSNTPSASVATNVAEPICSRAIEPPPTSVMASTFELLPTTAMRSSPVTLTDSSLTLRPSWKSPLAVPSKLKTPVKAEPPSTLKTTELSLAIAIDVPRIPNVPSLSVMKSVMSPALVTLSPSVKPPKLVPLKV